MDNKRKINIKIEGQASPFQYQVTDADTFINLKNKLYLAHQKIVDMTPYINGRIQMKQLSMRVYQAIQKYPQFVFLMFNSQNSIPSAAIGNKNAGLSDQALKPDYLRSFSTSSTVEAKRSSSFSSQLKPVQLSKQGKSPTTSFRITDLSHQQLLKLLDILKVQSGRYMDQKLQVVTSNKQAIQYTIKQIQCQDIIQDKGISHFFQNQNITQQTKQVYQQGFKDKQLRNKIPYLFAFSLDHQQDYFKFEKAIQKTDYTYVQHCFPRGQVNLVTVQAQPQEQMLKYFNNQDYSYQNIINFYRTYGQFLIRKFTVGLKRVCSQKIIQGLQSKTTQQVQRSATLAAGRIRQYMLQTTTQFGQGTKTTTSNTKTDQSRHYDIKAIGGAIQHCQNVALWKQSVNVWQLWRIISVNQIQRIQNYLPLSIQQRIQQSLNNRVKYINDMMYARSQKQTALADKISSSKQSIKIQSNFQTIASFKQKIYQILYLDDDNLVLVFIDKIMKFNLMRNQVDFSLEFRERGKCIYDKQLGYITATIYDNCAYIATQNGIVKINFNDLTFKVISSGNWRQSTFLMFYKNKLYANGWKGIYQINPKTGQYSVIIGGDWRFYTGTRIKNNVYMFSWNIYCLDMDSMTYSKLANGLWNQFWDNYTYPTNDGNRIWHFYKGSMYCFNGSKYFPVEFVKKGVSISKFTSRSMCYGKGCLYLSNNDHNEHLMKIPI